MADVPQVPVAGLQALLEMADFGACLVDPQGWRVIYANGVLRQAFTLTACDGTKSLVELLPEMALSENLGQLEKVAAGRLSEFVVKTLSLRQESLVKIRRVGDESGALLAVTLSHAASDGVTEGAREGFDSLTGLADRGRLLERLTQLLQGVRTGDQRCAVLFLDLDGFKQVNDAHGHLTGDEVLREVAERLVQCVRSGDMVARFGGDEFIVLLERVTSEAEVAPVLRRLEAAFRPPIAMSHGEIQLGVSVGVAQAGVDGATAEELICSADRAMYAAKRKSD